MYLDEISQSWGNRFIFVNFYVCSLLIIDMLVCRQFQMYFCNKVLGPLLKVKNSLDIIKLFIFSWYLTFKNFASYIQDGHTATIQTLHFIYIYFFLFSTNISTEYFKHAAHSPFFSSKCLLFHNATFFGSCIINILHTGVLKLKCKIWMSKG
jgi:hypothetical protein